jgi:O-succinylbenzoate synthase
MATPDFSEFLQHPLSIRQLHLHIIDLPQKKQFRSGIGIRKSRQALILKWEGPDGIIGYGESSCRPDPFYSAEFLTAGVELIHRFIFPQLKSVNTYGNLLKCLKKIRGWHFTKAAVEFAAHDYIRQKTGDTLFHYWPHPRINQIPVGISMGIQESQAALHESVDDALHSAYHRLKFKVYPEFDVEVFRTALPKLQSSYVSFDANGTLGIKDLSLIRFLTSFGSAIEQPFPPHRVDFFQEVKAQLPQLKVCPDEEIKSIGMLKALHQLHAVDELNLKIGRVGGLFNSLQIVDYCFRENIPVWIGGMFETGIGRSLNLQVASCLPQARAHDLSPSSRYFVEDLLSQPVEMDDKGYIHLDTVQQAVNGSILEKYTTDHSILKT